MVAGARPATGAASGRYQRSLPFRAGVRYWATTLEKSRTDKFGVQFLGEGIALAHKVESDLLRHRFIKQSTQPTQITYCRAFSRLPGDAIDEAAIREIKAEIDAVLDLAVGGGTEAARAGSGQGFRAFMLKSPLADADIVLTERDPRWRDGVP